MRSTSSQLTGQQVFLPNPTGDILRVEFSQTSESLVGGIIVFMKIKHIFVKHKHTEHLRFIPPSGKSVQYTYWHVNIQLSCCFYCLSVLSHSGISNSLQPHGLRATRLLCPWNSPGKNTGAEGCHFLLQGIFLTQGSNLRLLH